eukprot:6172413-Pleurochrysis_carterae.AAC.6
MAVISGAPEYVRSVSAAPSESERLRAHQRAVGRRGGAWSHVAAAGAAQARRRVQLPRAACAVALPRRRRHVSGRTVGR